MSSTQTFGPFLLGSPEATQALAGRLAKIWQGGSVLALQGDLGAGKTCFAKGLISAATELETDDVMSPTFTLAIEYPEATPPIVHVDAYRLQSGADLVDLGFEDWLAEGRRVLVEWPERVGAILPPETLRLCLSFVSEDARRLTVIAPESGAVCSMAKLLDALTG